MNNPGHFDSEDEDARREWEDKYRWCVHCGCDCWVDEPEHAATCPQETGVWTMREEETMPCPHCHKPTRMTQCMDCHAPINAGDSYMLREVDTKEIANGIPRVGGEVVCVGCGMHTELSAP